MTSLLSGKGIWIRRIAACEQGDLATIVNRAQAAGFNHVILKIADGADSYNADTLTAPELIRRLREAGLMVWGWHYLYGDKPRFKGPFQNNYHTLEAERAVQVITQLREAGLQGYVMNAEGEYERAPRRSDKAAEFMAALRAGVDDFPFALASWKFPNSHKRFPWVQFRQYCVLDLPQVFWMGRNREAAAQLEKSFQQYTALEPQRPYVPVAPAFFENGWRPSPTDLEHFITRAGELGLPGFNLWAWDYVGLRGDEITGNPERLDFREYWRVIAKTEWKEIKETRERISRRPDTLAPAAVELELPRPLAPATHEVAAELTSFGLEATEVESAEDLSTVSFGLPAAAESAPASAFTPEPLPAAESEELRARLQDVAERYAESFRDLRTAHRDQLIALGAQSLLGASAKEEPPSVTLSGQVVGETAPIAPTIDEKAPTPTPAPEQLPDELTAELEALTASDESREDLPDWLQERDFESAELTGEDVEPARPFAPEAEVVVLDLLPEELIAELESLTANDDETDDLPEWLTDHEIEAVVTAEEAEPVRPFAPEAKAVALDLLPDELVAELESLTASDEIDEGLPDWLQDRDTVSAELTEEDTEPARPFAPETEAIAPDLLPEELIAELEALTASEDVDIDLPEWLREAESAFAELAEEDAEPARPYAAEAETIALDLRPDELVAEFESLTSSDESEEDLPDWLQDLDLAALELTDEAAEPVRPFAPEAEAIALDLAPDELVAELETLMAGDESEEDLPDWLQDRDLEAAKLTDEDAEPARPFTSEVEAVVPDLMPDELIAEFETLTASDEGEAGLPEWLLEREFESTELSEEDAEPTRPFAPEAAAVVPDLMPDELVAELEELTASEDLAEDLPEWLQDFDVEAVETRLSEEDTEPTRPFAPEAEEFAFTLAPDELTAELQTLTTGDAEGADADLPEWLQDFSLESADVDDEEAEPMRPFAPEPEPALGTLIAPPPAPATSPTVSKLFKALGSGRLEEAFRLYAPEFTLVHARQLAHDRTSLRRFYLWLLPGLQRETLVVRSLHVNRLTVQVQWACLNWHGQLIEGSDTFHLNRREHIVYHHTTLDFAPDTT